MRNIQFITLFCITSVLLIQCKTAHKNKAVPCFNREEIIKYEAPKLNARVIIDGKPDELHWKNLSFINSFQDITGKEIDFQKTKVKCFHDNSFLYIYAQLKEKNIWSEMINRDDHLYLENAFEIFIDPDNDGLNYIELQVNPHNTLFDITLDKPYKYGGKANFDFEMENIQHAVHIHGTLNNNNDDDKYWAVEMAIPINEIEKYNLNKSNQDLKFYRFQLVRVNWNIKKKGLSYEKTKQSKPHYTVWQIQSEIDNHKPKDWGILILK